MNKNDGINPLCCCEYIDRQDERNHILGCCCNCIDFDQAFDRLITCRSISNDSKREMLLTFQDRLRLPWRGGAAQISIDTILPYILVPLMLIVASTHICCALAMCLIMPMFLGYAYYHLKRLVPRTKFFFSWALVSAAYLCILFQTTVPLLEILPEENIILLILITGSLICHYKARKRAPLNHVVQSSMDEDNLPDITEEHTSLLINDDGDSEESEISQPNICPKCRKYVPARTFHCKVCQACIVKRDHHNIWLDCCIGDANHRYFFFGCLFGFYALVFGSNLSLTSICHPFLIANFFGIYVFLPDDCSDVFDQFDVSLCFIGSIYAILMAVCTLLMLIQQVFFISKGVTGTEWRHGVLSNQRSLFWNWKSYICCNR